MSTITPTPRDLERASWAANRVVETKDGLAGSAIACGVRYGDPVGNFREMAEQRALESIAAELERDALRREMTQLRALESSGVAS